MSEIKTCVPTMEQLKAEEAELSQQLKTVRAVIRAIERYKAGAVEEEDV